MQRTFISQSNERPHHTLSTNCIFTEVIRASEFTYFLHVNFQPKSPQTFGHLQLQFLFLHLNCVANKRQDLAEKYILPFILSFTKVMKFNSEVGTLSFMVLISVWVVRKKKILQKIAEKLTLWRKILSFLYWVFFVVVDN